MPLAFYFGWLLLPLIPTLWLIAAGCLIALLHDRTFDRRRLWKPRALRRALTGILITFVVSAPLLLLATLQFDPERLFAFVRQRPLLWLLVMLLYPVLSAYPQGLVFRDFIFHRYRALFGTGRGMILASAVAFSFGQVVFHNWIAPVLSLAAGILFART